MAETVALIACDKGWGWASGGRVGGRAGESRGGSCAARAVGVQADGWSQGRLLPGARFKPAPTWFRRPIPWLSRESGADAGGFSGPEVGGD
jgi:hypothetical protein